MHHLRQPRVLSLETIISIHDGWIARKGGSLGVWEPNVLQYAHEAQFSPYYEGLFKKAANLGGRITKEHAFVDGNKRTGYSCIQRFLALNGFSFRPSFSDAYEVFRRLALGTNVPGEITYEELAQWVEANALPLLMLESYDDD